MLKGLYLYNFISGSFPEIGHSSHLFVLKTCQRTLWLTFEKLDIGDKDCEIIQGQEAYLFLLETISGLKSRLLGENEIVGQFKSAYNFFAGQTVRDARVLKVLEKLFKDGKDIRTQYFMGLGQKTYASITRKHFFTQKNAKRVVILGSGQLAIDLINQLKKKVEVVICARNTKRVEELCLDHKITSIPWENWELLVKEAFIANTIGTDSVLLNNQFFKDWQTLHQERHFVDLGSPSPFTTTLSKSEGFIRLDDILSEEAILETQKYQQINNAREAMIKLSAKRTQELEEKSNQWHPSLKLYEGKSAVQTAR